MTDQAQEKPKPTPPASQPEITGPTEQFGSASMNPNITTRRFDQANAPVPPPTKEQPGIAGPTEQFGMTGMDSNITTERFAQAEALPTPAPDTTVSRLVQDAAQLNQTIANATSPSAEFKAEELKRIELPEELITQMNELKEAMSITPEQYQLMSDGINRSISQPSDFLKIENFNAQIADINQAPANQQPSKLVTLGLSLLNRIFRPKPETPPPPSTPPAPPTPPRV